jgi:lipopolysaccharide export system protein LptA
MNKFILFLLAVMGLGFCAQAKELLEIKGDYLLYSFDFNYVYGQGNIIIKAKEFSIQAAAVEIDMVNRVALVSRNCQVQLGKENYAADILEIDLDTLSLKLTTFKENILSGL